MVPNIYWDDCDAAIREYSTLVNEPNIEHEVSNFYRSQHELLEQHSFQHELLEQHKTAPGEGGGAASSTPNSEKFPSSVKFQAPASCDKDVSKVVHDPSGFSAEAHRKLAPYIQHTQSANELVEAQLRRIDGKEISSIIENARLLSSSERKIQAPKLYGIFGLDPYLYLASQEIRRRTKTNKILEDSSIPTFADVGRKIRDEIDQRTRTTPGYEPTLDDVKTVGESKYIAAVGRASTEDSGGGGGGGSRRGASKVSVRGLGGGGDSGPHAAAHLARGRVITCYNYDKEGHYSRDCPESRRPHTRQKYASRSPSSFH